ncbi:MAG: hypothetical protein U1C73_01615, partial [Dietzia sp.]|nr:hypothetical protein [Dietzia sp.]
MNQGEHTKMTKRWLAALTLGPVIALLSTLGGAHASASTDSESHEEVRAERMTACATDGVSLTCFDTEADLDMYLAKQWKPERFGSASATCSTPLRLYAGTNQSGSVLAVTARGVWVNLSTSFNNQTSSYRVGACSSLFAAGTNGTGGFYPGNTSAWATASQMLLGWNNRVSSVYLY